MSDYPLESFVFYRSFRDAIQEMSDTDQLSTLLAICDYALYGVEPKLNGVLPRAVFTVARPSIDANKAKRMNGKKGGRPKKETAGFDGENHRFLKIESTETVTETESVSVSASETSKADKPPRSRFVPPTVEEVQTYCRERKNSVDAAVFVDFYQTNGWLQGKGKPIKDWKAAVRTWERRECGNERASSPLARTFDPETGSWR